VNRPPWHRRAPESGFVLVGVLMFILVLTILGLTLFSLSGYESQFYNDSRDGQKAFYAALSGIERTKFVLASTGKLLDAQDVAGVQIDGLVYAVARQGDVYDDADSTGVVKWGPTSPPVWIRSLAIVNHRRMLLEARFRARRPEEDYRRLFTLTDVPMGLKVELQVKDPASPDPMNPIYYPAAQQVYLDGGLSQVSMNAAAFAVAGQLPAPASLGDTLSTPDLVGFWGAHGNPPGGLTPVAPNANDQYDLDASTKPDRIGFFLTSFAVYPDDPVNGWSLNADAGNGIHAAGDASITVRGTCIWMFDKGVRFSKKLQISGSGGGDDALVIVALRSGDTREFNPPRGIVLGGGITSTVPVVLVTDTAVGIEQYPNIDGTSDMRYLSVFTGNCRIIGPKAGTTMTLRHKDDAPEDLPGGLIDRLSQKGYLPNTSPGQNGDFTLIAGTWREIKNSDGKN
jgi:hypothetical protein